MLVFDTSAVIKLRELEGLTVPEVVEEVKNRPSVGRMDSAISAGQLSVQEPDGPSLTRVQRACFELGEDIGRTDKHLLALALMKNATLVTDDYSMQNVGQFLGIKIQPVEQRGIRQVLKWGLYCTACKKFRTGKDCPVCGHSLIRRAVTSL